MNKSNGIASTQKAFTTYAAGAGIAWTALIGAALAAILVFSWRSSLRNLEIQAEQAFEKDVVYRRWSAQNGGVYVPVSEHTPPNPYLSHIPTRDIVLPDRTLTLVNPAYMTRQVHQLGERQYGHKGHITSLKPLRPENIPDEWEAATIRKFAGGTKKVVELSPIGGKDYLRLMRPLFMEKSCLKCHGEQGYKLGDLRGGVSVSIPTQPVVEAWRQVAIISTGGLGILWIVGLAAIAWGVRRLKQHAAELEIAAKQAGKAEIAAGILHNVGNALNSLRTRTHLAYTTAGKIDDRGIGQAVELLKSNAADLGPFFDEGNKGPKLIQYLSSLANQCGEKKEGILTYLNEAKGAIQHIEEVIRMQQAHARTAGPEETLAAADLIQEAIRFQEEPMVANKVELALDIQDDRPFAVQKHKTLQILVNLLSNARAAVSVREEGDRCVTVRFDRDDDEVLFSVIDNGSGIDADNLERVFEHGFTTKANGHGFGLHMCQVTAKELGGKLKVSSEGLDKGARFDLSLPASGLQEASNVAQRRGQP